MITIKMTEGEFRALQSAYEGVCIGCGEIRSCTEPDAENYDCEACGENKVVGADIALVTEVIEIVNG